ncbi:hypothetical protein A8B78_21905 [Jannaschia sp. EhC01]|nr:hypothetical protein A8B78_21905 [Jannaschia sp. EhC01]
MALAPSGDLRGGFFVAQSQLVDLSRTAFPMGAAANLARGNDPAPALAGPPVICRCTAARAVRMR